MARVFFRFLFTMMVWLGSATAQEIKPHTWTLDKPLVVHEDQNGVQATFPTGEPVQEVQFSGFDLTTGQPVFMLTLMPSMRHPFKTNQGGFVVPGVYLCHILVKTREGKMTRDFGRLTRTGSTTTFVTGITLYNEGKVEDAARIFRHGGEVFPTDPNVWFLHGATLYRQSKTAPAAQYKAKAEETIRAYSKALEFAATCQMRDNALGYIATVYDELGDADKNREWLLQRTAGECATKEIKTTTFYAIGVKYWQQAYDLSTRFADQKRLTTAPFHARRFPTPADRAQFEQAVANAFEYIEKALVLNPDYAEAWSYKSLLYREKQKGTANPTAHRQFADEAEKAAKIAIALTARAKSKNPSR